MIRAEGRGRGGGGYKFAPRIQSEIAGQESGGQKIIGQEVGQRSDRSGEWIHTPTETRTKTFQHAGIKSRRSPPGQSAGSDRNGSSGLTLSWLRDSVPAVFRPRTLRGYVW